MFESAKVAQKAWARTPLYKRAEVLHKVASLMRQYAQPIADCLVKEVRDGRRGGRQRGQGRRGNGIWGRCGGKGGSRDVPRSACLGPGLGRTPLTLDAKPTPFPSPLLHWVRLLWAGIYNPSLPLLLT